MWLWFGVTAVSLCLFWHIAHLMQGPTLFGFLVAPWHAKIICCGMVWASLFCHNAHSSWKGKQEPENCTQQAHTTHKERTGNETKRRYIRTHIISFAGTHLIYRWNISPRFRVYIYRIHILNTYYGHPESPDLQAQRREGILRNGTLKTGFWRTATYTAVSPTYAIRVVMYHYFSVAPHLKWYVLKASHQYMTHPENDFWPKKSK